MKRTLKHLTAAAALAGLVAACTAQANQGSELVTQAGPELTRAERMFQRFDMNKDGQVTREEAKAKAIQRFTRMDADANGVVTRKERKTMRKARRFKRFDANADGALSLDEMKAGAMKRAERRFARLDTNGDGSLSLAEVQAGKGRRGDRKGKRAGRKGSMTLQDLDARVMRMFDRADQNADGVITPDEAKLMRRHGRRS